MHTDSTEQLCARRAGLGDGTHRWHRRMGRLHHAWVSIFPSTSTSPRFLLGGTSKHQPLFMDSTSHKSSSFLADSSSGSQRGTNSTTPPSQTHPSHPAHTAQSTSSSVCINPAAAAPAPHQCHPHAAPAAPHHDVVTLHLRFLAGEFVAFQLQAGKAERSERTTSRRAAGRILQGPSRPAG